MSCDPYLFGGSPKQVRRTQRRFIRWFASSPYPILDIGCGRGIFLEMLRSAGLKGIGIDTYEPAIEYCRAQGFTVAHADALEYLRRRTVEGGTSFGGIFCSHVIEHLPYEPACELITLAAANLVRGGTLILVTPNSRDFGVMGETFWLDPTHVRPYPLPLLTSMVESAGLSVAQKGAFHGGLPKRELGRALLYRAFLGPFHGRPNAYVVARKPE